MEDVIREELAVILRRFLTRADNPNNKDNWDKEEKLAQLLLNILNA